MSRKNDVQRLKRSLLSLFEQAYREHGQAVRVQRYYLSVSEMNKSREFHIDLQFSIDKVVTITAPWTNRYDPPAHVLREIEDIEIEKGHVLHHSYDYEYDDIGVDIDHVCAIYTEAI